MWDKTGLSIDLICHQIIVRTRFNVAYCPESIQSTLQVWFESPPTTPEIPVKLHTFIFSF